MEKENSFDKNYILAFVLGFFIFGIAVLPSVLMEKGIWIYYGDFNVQQIPFYMHAHRAIKSGNFLYDFSTDMGGSLIGMYSFYLLASPFFLLTLLFKTETVPYLMPWISALKYAVMALTSYLYLKKHVKNKNYALLGAMLYSFSGFQGAVLVYNHFHDVMAFFPLYLYLFDRMVEKKKVVAFTLMTTFMLCLNYYFFVGEVVFLVIYYLCRFKFNVKDFFRALLTGVTGVLLSGIYIIPAIYYTLENKRLTQFLNGYDLVAYKDSPMVLGIIKSLALLPDVSGLNSLLNLSGSRVSGVAGYIPLFSIAFVVAFFLYNKGWNWIKKLLTVSAVFALVPGLNAMFSAFNKEYYARWFYMPLLFMALATVKMLEERSEAMPEIKKGLYVLSVITAVVAIIAVLPAQTESGDWTVLGALKNYEQLISELVFSFAMLALLYLYVFIFSKKNVRFTYLFTLVACFATCLTMLITGTVLVDQDRKTDFIKQGIKGEYPLKDKEGFFRYETDEDFYNYPLMWEGSHSITSFISTIADSTLEFYDALEVPRKVTSNPYPSRLGIRAITSSRYFLQNTKHSIEFIGHIEDMSDLKDYNLLGLKNGFQIYENKNYIPMGFSFDSFIIRSVFEESEATTLAKDRLLVKALIIEDEDREDFLKVMEEAEPESITNMTISSFETACEERRESACKDFSTYNNGFSALSNLDKDNYVFFSIPYEEGFKAYIDGEEADIKKVDFGFMAVYVPKGQHLIEFKYTLSGLAKGKLMTLIGACMFFCQMIISVYNKERSKNKESLI